MTEIDAVRSLAALAQEVRLRVFRALVVAGRARDLREGVRLAAAAIDEGRALRLLERIKETLA